MKKKTQSSEDKIRAMLKEAEDAVKIEVLRGEHGGSSDKPASGARRDALGPSDAKRLKQLEDENRRLRSLVADLTLSNQALKLAVSKKW